MFMLQGFLPEERPPRRKGLDTCLWKKKRRQIYEGQARRSVIPFGGPEADVSSENNSEEPITESIRQTTLDISLI